jgi:hypothetical protein
MVQYCLYKLYHAESSVAASSKPVVRLQRTTEGKRVHNATTAGVRPATIKLAIRLNEGVNDALRTLVRYRGDLSNMGLEALACIDLSRVALVRAEDPMVADTTITLPRALHEKL